MTTTNDSFVIGPSIGVARVGTSRQFYIGPETSGGLPTMPDGAPFRPGDVRDGRGQIRRQAARFRVFRYPASGGPPEVVVPGRAGIAAIRWTVHLANKKPIWYEFNRTQGEGGYAPNHPLRNSEVTDPAERAALIIDPGPRSLDAPNRRASFSRTSNPHGYPMSFPPENLEPWSIDTLGDMATDDEGRLLVLGGHGHSGSRYRPVGIKDYANNDGWWDDVSDGPVTAEVVLDGGATVDATAAWVVVGLPGFAPEIVNLVTLYDVMFDVAVRHLGRRPEIYADGEWNRSYRPSWERDLRPILERGHRYPWVVPIPPKPHTFDYDVLGDPDARYDSVRRFYLDVLRPPNEDNSLSSASTGYVMMPYLAGDDPTGGQETSAYLRLTDTQYFLLQQWANGRFTVGAAADDDPVEALSKAVLDNYAGGSFSPGMEVTWISRDPAIYTDLARIRVRDGIPSPLSLGGDPAHGLEPGDVTKYMALPWQTDFNDCNAHHHPGHVLWWWPAQRPVAVYREVDDRLVQQPWVGIDYDQNAADYYAFPREIDMVTNWDTLGFVVSKDAGGEAPYLEY